MHLPGRVIHPGQTLRHPWFMYLGQAYLTCIFIASNVIFLKNGYFMFGPPYFNKWDP